MTISDIYSEIRKLCDADSASYIDADILRRVNAAYEKTVGRIMCQDGNWEFDDTNYTDFPRATTTLVAGQKDYTFDTSHLAIESVQVMDENGHYYYLKPISKDDYSIPLDEYYSADGRPEVYDKDGKSVLIYPGPAAGNVTLALGLLVHFRRTADIFTSAQVTTETKVPGFASPFHMILAYEAAIPFCMSYKKDRVALYEKKSMDLMEECLRFYAQREKDVENIMSNKGISFR